MKNILFGDQQEGFIDSLNITNKQAGKEMIKKKVHCGCLEHNFRILKSQIFLIYQNATGLNLPIDLIAHSGCFTLRMTAVIVRLNLND